MQIRNPDLAQVRIQNLQARAARLDVGALKPQLEPLQPQRFQAQVEPPHDPLNGFQTSSLPGLDLMTQFQALLGRIFGGAPFPQDAAGHTLVNGGAGNDRIEVRSGPMGGAYVTSNGKTSYLTAEEAKKLHIAAGAGDDQVFVDPNFPYAVTIDGGAGNDVLVGGAGADLIRGGAGRDVIVGNRGNDRLVGGGGDDVLIGSYGNDHVSGGNGRDQIHAGYGDDVVSGGRGNDRIHGGAGNDRLHGNQGADVIHGDGGNDRVHGGGGDDRVFGGYGDDRLWGNAGDDHLRGGRGNDRAWGGAGNDDVRLY